MQRKTLPLTYGISQGKFSEWLDVDVEVWPLQLVPSHNVDATPIPTLTAEASCCMVAPWWGDIKFPHFIKKHLSDPQWMLFAWQNANKISSLTTAFFLTPQIVFANWRKAIGHWSLRAASWKPLLSLSKTKSCGLFVTKTSTNAEMSRTGDEKPKRTYLISLLDLYFSIMSYPVAWWFIGSTIYLSISVPFGSIYTWIFTLLSTSWINPKFIWVIYCQL